MNKAEFTERLQSIGTEADETQRRELIAQLIEDGGKDYDAHAAAVEARDNALKDNEDLRAANMKLFKRVGNPGAGDPSGDPSGEQPTERRKFENLFDEKGGIK